MKQIAVIYFWILLAFLTACDSSPPPAMDSSPAPIIAATGDVKLGQQLTFPCENCHGSTGIATKNGTPYLAGQNIRYLASTLHAYQDGLRKHPYMQKILLKFTDTDLLNISTFYSKQTGSWKGANGIAIKPTKHAAISRGQVAKTACVGCHGINGNSDNPAVPSLAGLQPQYFITAFENYFADRRKGTVMKHFKQSVNWQTLQDLAVYYSAQTRTKKSFSLLGDPVKGQKLAHLCHGCHGIRGSTVLPNMPDLANQNVKYLRNAILSYNNGKRQNALMTQATRKLNNAQVRQLASYYAQIELPALSHQQDNTFAPILKGKHLAQNCQGCHGENGNSVTAGTPSISGLSVDYFKKSFRDYATGHREHRMMPLFAKHINDSQLEKLALYYQQADISIRKPFKNKLNVDKKFLIACNGCHGNQGRSTEASTPSLAGQQVDYIRNALHTYKKGIRQHSGMQNATKDLSDDNINQLADHYSSQTPEATIAAILTPPQELAQKCNRCHGPYGKSVSADIPRLAGQSETYLINALLDYKNNNRKNSMMYAMSEVLSLSEIEAIARYYAKQ